MLVVQVHALLFLRAVPGHLRERMPHSDVIVRVLGHSLDIGIRYLSLGLDIGILGTSPTGHSVEVEGVWRTLHLDGRDDDSSLGPVRNYGPTIKPFGTFVYG